MKVIDLLNKIANGEIEDKRTFNIRFGNGLCRSIYYDKEEENCMCCLKNVSDDYEVEIIEDTPKEDKKIEKLNMDKLGTITDIKIKINEIIDRLNGEDNE